MDNVIMLHWIAHATPDYGTAHALHTIADTLHEKALELRSIWEGDNVIHVPRSEEKH